MSEAGVPGSVRVARILAWSGLVLLCAGPLVVRSGLMDFRPGLLAVALGVLDGAAALLLALGLMTRGALAAHRAALGRSAAIALLPVAAGVLMLAPAIGKPVIHDISTDLADPPQFSAAVARRGPDANPLARDAALDAAQRAGYPALEGVRSGLPPEQALQRAADVARELGWEVHAQDAAAGLLEASETTFWFRFTDDVAIRVRPEGSGSRIDLRSVSRVGKGDLGANARRIERFAERFGAAP
jgi:uncharacterized protein (DUF1499 family)